MITGRASGLLLHPTSFPGKYGIGDFGKEAREFIDFLSDTRQKLWQILPLHPTGYGNSPYQCFSVHAGNPLLISLDELSAQGLLNNDDLAEVPRFPVNTVDYEGVNNYKIPLLRKSFGVFEEDGGSEYKKAFEAFCREKDEWLDIYSLFMALREAHDYKAWYEWEEGLRERKDDALEKWRRKHGSEIRYHKYTQFQFFRQWKLLKNYCNEKGIQIIGDIPIFVALDSASVWAYPRIFYLDDSYTPTVVAGVPPDYFSRTGQRWGNPLYRWDAMAKSGYSWWIERFRATREMVDMNRLDHFRGFERYWEVPADCPTAAIGRWAEGPGADLFKSLENALGKLPVIAEDLGVITKEVDLLRDQMDYPGMRVLQFAFGNDPKADDYKPHNFIRNCVVYTGTHDNDTVIGWFNDYNSGSSTQTKSEWLEERRNVLRYTGTDGADINWDFIRLALSSIADKSIVPLQDVLGLGSEARMNYPGTTSGNWRWRYTSDMLTDEIKDRLKELTEVYGR